MTETSTILLLGMIATSILSSFMPIIVRVLTDAMMSIIRAKHRITLSSVESKAKTKTLMRRLKQNVWWSGFRDINDNPIGIIVGKWFIAKVEHVVISTQNDATIGYDIKLFSWSDVEFSFNKDDEEDNNSDQKKTEKKKPKFPKISWLEKEHPHLSSDFTTVKKLVPHESRPKQEIIIDEILTKASEFKETIGRYGASCFIHGKPGTGKSAVAERLTLQLAEEHGGAFICHYDPTFPGVWLNNIIEETDGKPLVLLVNEIDVMVKNCYTEQFNDKPNWIRSHARTKGQWNNHLDDLAKHDNIFVIGTSNSSINEIINSVGGDDSMLRQGRMDLFFEM